MLRYTARHVRDRLIEPWPTGRNVSAWCHDCEWQHGNEPNYIRVSNVAQRHCADTGHAVQVTSTAVTIWRAVEQ